MVSIYWLIFFWAAWKELNIGLKRQARPKQKAKALGYQSSIYPVHALVTAIKRLFALKGNRSAITRIKNVPTASKLDVSRHWLRYFFYRQFKVSGCSKYRIEISTRNLAKIANFIEGKVRNEHYNSQLDLINVVEMSKGQ